MKRLEVSHLELLGRIAANIANEKRQIIGVLGTGKHPPFAYTIGNQEKLLPELLILGNFAASETNTILCDLSDKMLADKKPWPLGENVWGDHKFMIHNGGSEAKAKYTCQAGQFYGNEDYEVLQVVLPDTNGRWPEDPLCHKAFKVPIVGLTGQTIILR